MINTGNRSSRSSTVDVSTLSETARAARKTARNFSTAPLLRGFGVEFVIQLDSSNGSEPFSQVP
jgi:hypothetical protein